MNVRKIITILLMLILTMPFIACSTKVSPENQNTTDLSYQLEVLKLEGGTDWGIPNPFLHDPRGPGNAKMKLVFDSLLEADEKGDIPWLAKEWSIEGNTYIFTIHENAKFHDGERVTTADIAFTLDYYEKHSPITNYLAWGEGSIVSNYEIVDDYTIKITVAEPLATTLTKLGSFVILPKHIWEKVEDPYTYNEPEAIIGCGAYKFGSYDSATGSYEFIAFDDYYGHKPVTKRLLFVPVSDPILAFTNREIDITDVPFDLMDRYMDDPSIGMIGKDNDFGYKMLLNMDKLPVFKNVEMRKALYNAIDRKSIVDKVFRGKGSVASAGYVPISSIFYNDQVINYDYEPDKAAKLFADENIVVSLLTGNAGTDVKIAELLKINLEEAGIKVKVVAVDSKVRDERIFAGEYDFALVGNGGWGRSPDYLRTLYSSKSKFTGTNPHFMGPIGYDNEKITRLAEEQLKELDFNKRVAMFKELQYEISKEIPIIVIANQTSYVMYNKEYYDGWVKTYDYQQLEQNRMSYVEK
ncbi:MAG: ABC transporter substrate-binding protein [Peptococcales bacterium]|jgi:peptide/nickel transport system substrate-binding protein